VTTAAAPRIHHKPDEADRALLNELQAGLAFVPEPYAEIGSRIAMGEDEVLRRL
jgi:siroheme decarboxylase